MVEVTVARLGLDSGSQSYVVILQEKGGSRILPIWIGRPEAESIVMQMNGVKRERPLTHDLCRTLITGLGATLRRVQITKVQQNTYFAELFLEQRDGSLLQVDARPSDSIAIALRLQAPIFAQESLLGGVPDDDDDADADDVDAADAVDAGPGANPPRPGQPERAAGEMSADELKEHLERLRPEDFGKFSP